MILQARSHRISESRPSAIIVFHICRISFFSILWHTFDFAAYGFLAGLTKMNPCHAGSLANLLHGSVFGKPAIRP